MTRDEIKIISEIVGGDDTYRHFVHRINKEFDIADLDHRSQVKVLFQKKDSEIVGFSVIGISPSKMKTWEEIFKEENWVSADFNIKLDSHELMYMYIKPEYRKKGYGKTLLNQAFDHARESGADNVYAYVSDRSDSSLSFYKSMKASVIHHFADDGVSTAFIKWDL